MTKEQFKIKYLINAFIWITKENHLEIQKILQEFGIKCHRGKGFINWHDGFNNLCTFSPDKWHDYEFYQKADMFIPGARYGEAKDVKSMINDYSQLIIRLKSCKLEYGKEVTKINNSSNIHRISYRSFNWDTNIRDRISNIDIYTIQCWILGWLF